MKQLKIIVILLAILVAAGNGFLFVRALQADTTPPTISLSTEELELSTSAETAEYLNGVTATDDRDGDLSDEVMVEHISQLTGDDTVQATYVVFDSAGNAASITRSIRYTDYTAPEFHLSKPLKFTVGAVVTLTDRLSAEDCLDGDITGKVRVTSSNLSNDTEGVSSLGVQVTNSLGDTMILELPVIFEAAESLRPEITLTDYIVYLQVGDTFDPDDYLESVSDPALSKDETAKTSKVKADDSEVDTSTAGTYNVTYSYRGEEADTQIILTVVVR